MSRVRTWKASERAEAGGLWREKRAWLGMRSRCNSREPHKVASYSARGITVCDRWWHSPAAFIFDVGLAPPDATLERIDNDRGYEPGNVGWATKQAQARNRRTSRLLEHDGRVATIVEWSEITNIRATVLYARVEKLGWPADRVLTAPIRMMRPRHQKGSE